MLRETYNTDMEITDDNCHVLRNQSLNLHVQMTNSEAWCKIKSEGESSFDPYKVLTFMGTSDGLSSTSLCEGCKPNAWTLNVLISFDKSHAVRLSIFRT